MELRPGYKQTEIGIVPEEWDVMPIGELFTFKNGLNKSKKYFGYGTPIVNYMDVFNCPALRLENLLGRVDVSKSELQSFEVRKGDVFFTRTSETVEEIGQAAAMLDKPVDTVFSGFVLRARPLGSVLADGFKVYCFSPRYFRQQVISRATYTTRALTNGRALSAAHLAVPPPPEQRAIAGALADVDAAIAATAKLLDKKCDLRTATMQRLLTGEVRLPGFSEEWHETRLGEHIRFQVGFPFRSKFFNTLGVGIRLIRNRDLKSDDEVVFYHGDLGEGYRVKNGDLLVSMDGDFSLKMWVGSDALLNQRVGRITSAGAVDTSYLSFRLVGNLQEVERRTSSTTVKHLSHRDVENIKLSLPPLSEQIAIAEIIQDVCAEIAALERRQKKLHDLKQAMMQALLTGRVRLPVETIEEAGKVLVDA